MSINVFFETFAFVNLKNQKRVDFECILLKDSYYYDDVEYAGHEIGIFPLLNFTKQNI